MVETGATIFDKGSIADGAVHAIRPFDNSQTYDTHIDTLLKSSWYPGLHQVMNATTSETVRFFENRGMSNLSVPVTTTSISSPMGLGSDSIPVEAVVNGTRVYLADSMQFLLELGTRFDANGVYYTSCSFRGEEVDNTHLSEFSHSEVEVVGSLRDIIELGTSYVHHLVQNVSERCGPLLEKMCPDTDHIERVLDLKGVFPEITFSEAFSRYGDEPGLFVEVAPGVPTITRAGETRLIGELGEAVWLTHLPRKACPFYQKVADDPFHCLSADLLLGFGEVLGCGERCVDHEELLESIRIHQVLPESYEWYIRMKELTPLPTAGFGLGLERYVMWLLAQNDIRHCTPWVRHYGEVVSP